MYAVKIKLNVYNEINPIIIACAKTEKFLCLKYRIKINAIEEKKVQQEDNPQ